jgi:hypothetical protein
MAQFCPECGFDGIHEPWCARGRMPEAGAVVDLTAERNKREQPDAEFMRKDEYGRHVYCFGVQYDHAGSQYSFHLWAYDWADAEAKVASMRSSATVFGKMFSVVPA